jgi:hypothetical protein
LVESGEVLGREPESDAPLSGQAEDSTSIRPARPVQLDGMAEREVQECLQTIGEEADGGVATTAHLRELPVDVPEGAAASGQQRTDGEEQPEVGLTLAGFGGEIAERAGRRRSRHWLSCAGVVKCSRVLHDGEREFR